MADPISNGSLAQRIFIGLGRIASRLPQVRGKTRLMLTLYRVLRLEHKHIRTQAQLRRPLKFQVQLDLHSWLQRVAFLTGGYEADTVAFLLDLHERGGRGGSFLDIGANIGLIAIPIAKSLTDARFGVIAVEAVPDNVAALKTNVALNQLNDVVRIIPQAVGATAGPVQIQVEGDLHAGEGTGTANILPQGSTYDCVRQVIDITTIDDLVRAGKIPQGCSVVKIDTDGYDLMVLQGAVEFLDVNRPVIFGEFSQHCLNWHGQSAADVASFASGCGYQVWRRGRGWKFRRLAEEDADFQQDLLLVPNEVSARFESLLEH